MSGDGTRSWRPPVVQEARVPPGSGGRRELLLLAAATLVALWVTRGGLGGGMPSGLDIPGHVALTDFAVDELFLEGRVDGWFPGFGSGYRMFGVNGPGLAALVGAVRVVLLGTVTTGQALGVLGVVSMAALPWAVAALSRELGAAPRAAAIHGTLALLVSFYSGGGLDGLYGTGLIAQNLALPVQLAALVVVLRAARHGGRGRIVGAGLLVAGLGLLHPVSVVVLVVLLPFLVVGQVVLADLPRTAARLAVMAGTTLGAAAFWLLPALRDWGLKGGATFWDQPAPLPGRLGEVLAGDLLLTRFAGWAIVAALAVTCVLAVFRPAVRHRLRGPLAAALFLGIGHALVDLGWGPHEVVMHLPVRGAALATVLLMQPLSGLLADAVDLAARRARVVAAVWVPVVVLLPWGVGWLVSVDHRPARVASAPSPGLALASGELAELVPPMGRHLLASPPAGYYGTTDPSRWLAAVSGTNSAHLYIWESTREDDAGRLAMRLFRRVDPADALRRLRRFGVTHVVVTGRSRRSALEDASGFRHVWEAGEAAIFAVRAESGAPPPEELLQPAAVDGGGSLAATARVREPERLAWDVAAPGGARVVAPVAFHPQWRAEVGREPVEVDRSVDGLVRFRVPGGRHRVSLRYVPRGTDQVAGLTTLATLVAAGGVVVWPSARSRAGRRAGRSSPADPVAAGPQPPRR